MKTATPPPDPNKVLDDAIGMVRSDLQKARHYIKKAAEIAVIAENMPKAEELAALYVELDEYVKKYEKTNFKIVD